IIGLAASAISAYFGLTPIPGAFLIGLALSRIHSPETIRRDFQILERVITPIFFAYAGILLNPWEINMSLDALPIALSLAGVGLIGKVLGCGLSAKLAGLPTRKALFIGTAMMPRAGVDIVIAVTGLSLGVIDQVVYSAALILIYVSSTITPPLVKLLYKPD
ncbi:MAG: cation:proton antiporter, partial [Desulfurococcales archaeon]|nr:cation:proton antiporter [Desulfurococcales archaeon]